MSQVPSFEHRAVAPAFRAVSRPSKPAKAGSPRITLRMTDAEYGQLKSLSAGMPISSYVRRALFGIDAEPRKARQRVPVKDHEVLAQILGLLGQSGMIGNLREIARQAQCGTLAMDDELEEEIKITCARIAWIRVKLIGALGLKDVEGQ